MKPVKNIEIEYRAKFSKGKYEKLLKFLLKKAKDLGADDKRVWFFVMPDKLLKVTHNISSKSGKITLKLTKIGKGSHFEEIEFPIAEEAVEPAIKLFNQLGYKYLFEPVILRHNFSYKGVEVALKCSKTWGYHLELEIEISSLAQKSRAEEKIFKVAGELEVTIMSEEELWEFTQNVEKTYKNPDVEECQKPEEQRKSLFKEISANKNKNNDISAAEVKTDIKEAVSAIRSKPTDKVHS